VQQVFKKPAAPVQHRPAAPVQQVSGADGDLGRSVRTFLDRNQAEPFQLG